MGRIDIPLGPEADEAQKPRCAWCGDISRTVCGRCKVRWYCTPRFALRMLLMDNKRVAAKRLNLWNYKCCFDPKSEHQIVVICPSTVCTFLFDSFSD